MPGACADMIHSGKKTLKTDAGTAETYFSEDFKSCSRSVLLVLVGFEWKALLIHHHSAHTEALTSSTSQFV